MSVVSFVIKIHNYGWFSLSASYNHLALSQELNQCGECLSQVLNLTMSPTFNKFVLMFTLRSLQCSLSEGQILDVDRCTPRKGMDSPSFLSSCDERTSIHAPFMYVDFLSNTDDVHSLTAHVLKMKTRSSVHTTSAGRATPDYNFKCVSPYSVLRDKLDGRSIII